MWPSSRPSSGTGRSRLTAWPGASAPRLVLASVSPITSAVNCPSPGSVTVTHTPLTAIEIPVCGASRGVRAANGQLGRYRQPVDPADLAEFFYDSGEHLRLSSKPVLSVRLRGCAMRRAIAAKATAEAARRWVRSDLPDLLAWPASVLPPIRTFTVGTGIPPVQPADGLGRVADYHRRFGVSPTPEHA